MSMAGAKPHMLRPGFASPVADAQRVFQACMRALSRPGRVVVLEAGVVPPSPLSPEMAAILLALADHETHLWLDPDAACTRAVAEFLTFHTGARLTADIADATFAVVTGVAHMPALAQLPHGTPEYPDRSATLLVQVAGLRTSGLHLEGPGIDGQTHIGFDGMAPTFADELKANRAAYPCGVDIVLAAPGAIVGLPRSVRLVTES